ncbi:MAG: ATP-binding protein [Bacteroidales bacterium]|nr:ATP-binding protein [Bacteroidales bacterium]
MKFFGRERELANLREIEEISQIHSQFTIVSGRRRIGKTELVKKAYEGKKMLYFFVMRKAEPDLCAIYIDEIRDKLGISIHGTIKSFREVFSIVMEAAKTQHFTLFIDEFQEFNRVNPSIFSEMQYVWDTHKGESKINLVVAGSVNTLLNKIFTDQKEPLYGRQTNSISVKAFPPSIMKEIMETYSPNYKKEDFLALYAFTGGVAKYVEIFVERKRLTQRTMLQTFLEPDSYFINEGRTMLVEEFGKDYGTYFSILSLIAEGKNSRAEIEDLLGEKELSGQLKKLMDDYELISKLQPLYEKSPNKQVRYRIRDNFLRFWFRYIYKYYHIIEAGAYAKLKEMIEKDFSTFTGLTLEWYFREKLIEQGEYTRIGYWLDRKGNNEIDIIAEDEIEKRLVAIEVKRQEKNLDFSILRAKTDVYVKTIGRYKDYQISYQGFSLEDM